ncbi:MAG: hypothetical protein EBR82_88645 [Caulobacteraceae bacterium]|nr:hypothetical protein [Caulobacteraceae bacterium]
MATRETFTAGQVLTAAEMTNVATAMVAINAQTGTTYTTVLSDDGKLVTCDNASAIALTIPPNSSVAYGIGTQINIMQLGAGTVTITAGAGVTLRSDGSKLKTNAQYAVATCCKIATDTWVVVGNLKA